MPPNFNLERFIIELKNLLNYGIDYFNKKTLISFYGYCVF